MQLPVPQIPFFGRRSKKRKTSRPQETPIGILHYWPVWVLLAVMIWVMFPNAVLDAPPTIVRSGRTVVRVGKPIPAALYSGGKSVVRVLRPVPGVIVRAGDNVLDTIGSVPGHIFGRKSASGSLAPLFTREVDYWSQDIQRWAAEYGVEPNLLATVMQIESCGHPTVVSYAGAQGLFQVMPFHFTSTEVQLDPDTNAMRGANFLKTCLNVANGDVGLAMACYNGGPSVVSESSALWDDQVRRYYTWGTGIYADALTQQSRSDTLDRWLEAGGARLCDQAAMTLGLR